MSVGTRLAALSNRFYLRIRHPDAWYGLADGRAYVRSESHVGKVKRIRNRPGVRVAPCTMRGKPLGPIGEGRARILPAAEEARAEAALRADYGLGRRLYEGAGSGMGVDMVYLEIAPPAEGSA